MNTLTAIHSRNSIAQLEEPGPSETQLDSILKAGLRANDHRRLRPWRFLVVRGEARRRLGELMLEVALLDEPDLSEVERKRCTDKTLRAPLIVMVVAATRPDQFDKVPEIEQLLSAGGAAQLMMLAAHAQGVGAIWRTGGIVYDARFLRGLGLQDNEKIVGMIYMGTPKSRKPLAELDLENIALEWTGN